MIEFEESRDKFLKQNSCHRGKKKKKDLTFEGPHLQKEEGTQCCVKNLKASLSTVFILNRF